MVFLSDRRDDTHLIGLSHEFPYSSFNLMNIDKKKRVQKPRKYLFLVPVCISFYLKCAVIHLNKLGPMHHISTNWACSTHGPQAV